MKTIVTLALLAVIATSNIHADDVDSRFLSLSEDALVLKQRKEFAKAADAMTEMSKLRPEHPAPWYGLGEIHGSDNPVFDKDKAVAAFHKFLDVATAPELREQRLAVRGYVMDLDAGKKLDLLADPKVKYAKWLGRWTGVASGSSTRLVPSRKVVVSIDITLNRENELVLKYSDHHDWIVKDTSCFNWIDGTFPGEVSTSSHPAYYRTDKGLAPSVDGPFLRFCKEVEGFPKHCYIFFLDESQDRLIGRSAQSLVEKWESGSTLSNVRADLDAYVASITNEGAACVFWLTRE